METIVGRRNRDGRDFVSMLPSIFQALKREVNREPQDFERYQEPAAAAEAPLKPLEGKVVEVHGVDGKIDQLYEVKEDPSVREPKVNPNGMRGRAREWREQDGAYVFLSFEGKVFLLPEENLRQYEPEPAPNGGFDAVWPVRTEINQVEAAMFMTKLIDCMRKRSYCLIQGFLSQEEQQAAQSYMDVFDNWMVPKEEWQAAYLGRDSCTKMGHEIPYSDDAEEFTVVDRLDRVFEHLSLSMAHVDWLLTGESPWGRTPATVLVPFKDKIEQLSLRQEPLSDEDYGEKGIVFEHLAFMDQRRTKMIFFVCCGGGSEVLIHTPNEDDVVARLTIKPGQILLIDQGHLCYTYKPTGKHLAMQSWMLGDPCIPDEHDRDVLLPDPLMTQRRLNIGSIMTRFAGMSSYVPMQHWNTHLRGVDTMVKVPFERWDMDQYYSAEGSAGLSYACHGSFCEDNLVFSLDAEEFGISHEEAEVLSPAQNMILEGGFDMLVRVGYTKDTCRRLDCGVFVADSGCEWGSACKVQSMYRYLGQSSCMGASRLSHCLGLVGPCNVADTACSSSLVATNLAASMLRRKVEAAVDAKGTAPDAQTFQALVMGVSVLVAPDRYIAFCKPRLLSRRGRCLTFDMSADGFARGEGCGGIFLRASDSEKEADSAYAFLCGSAVSQDGRAASILAPNGPSQSQVITDALEEGGFTFGDLTFRECHGLGSALGDPVEVKSLRDLANNSESPLLCSSSKTCVGHTEAAAGMAGVLRTIMQLASSAMAPNLHLHRLNPHMNAKASELLMGVEASELRANCGLGGISAFGFGGTNGSANLWGRCTFGSHATTSVNIGKKLQQRMESWARVQGYGRPGPQSSDRICIRGTWDAWTGEQEMDVIGMGEYETTIVLGETRREYFRIFLNGENDQAFHPQGAAKRSGAHVLGPDDEWKDKYWKIDGTLDSCHAGTVYKIRFSWQFSWDYGETKNVTWEPMPEDDPDMPLASQSYKHKYMVLGSWTSYTFQDMNPDPSAPGLWSTNVRIGITGQETFQFARDKDTAQVIHPPVSEARKTTIPVVGPSHEGRQKYWVIRGPQGELAHIQLSVIDGSITVTASSETKGEKTWTNQEVEGWCEYFITSTWNKWGYTLMKAEMGSTSKYTVRITLGETGYEDFRIVMEKDTYLSIYPHQAACGLGEGLACGPDPNWEGLAWRVKGNPGETFLVTFSIEEESPTQKVVWSKVEEGESKASGA